MKFKNIAITLVFIVLISSFCTVVQALASEETDVVAITNTNANVRTGAGTNNPVCKVNNKNVQLKNGTQVTILGTKLDSNGSLWYNVRVVYSGSTLVGYIKGTLINLPPDPEFAKLAPTTLMSFEELAGDDGRRDQPTRFPAADTYKIIVDLYHQVVLVYEQDSAGNYTVPVRYMVCSTGRDTKETATYTGTFQIGSQKVRFGLFKSSGVYGQYWTRMGNTNIYFHSILYSKRDVNSYQTSAYNNLGSKASHGCIRLLVPDARWLWYHCGKGTVMTIRNGSKKDIETATIKAKLIRVASPSKRQTFNAKKYPWTDNWSIDELTKDLKNDKSAVVVK
jgi:lipoprotein-anchoring transpeptidase ErfK/SrfK